MFIVPFIADKICLINVQRDEIQISLFLILQVHSTCFGCQPHPSSGVHKTVVVASGTGHIFCAGTSLQSCQASGIHKTVTTASGTVQLPPSNVATLEGGSCTKIMNSTGGFIYSFVYS